MKIDTTAPIESLVLDPFADRQLPAVDHGPFTALAQGADWRGKLERLEAAMLAHGEQAEFPVKHHFSNGVYTRELTIPKDAILTGKIHKASQTNILLKGEISVLTEHGIERLKAPQIIVSPPGTKRAGYAHEETVWVTISGTHETDLDTLENILTCRTYDEYESYCKLLEN
jgi:hypothetical protein